MSCVNTIKLFCQLFLELGQSVDLKFSLSTSSCLPGLISRVMMIGMWSILGGHSSGAVLHSRTCSQRELDASTLSSQMKFLVAIVHRVGMFLGSSICRL